MRIFKLSLGIAPSLLYNYQVNPIAHQVAEHGRAQLEFDYFDFQYQSDLFPYYMQ